MSDAATGLDDFGAFPADEAADDGGGRGKSIGAAPMLEPLDERTIADSLVRMGVAGSGERPRCQPLGGGGGGGGSSSEIWLVDVPGRRLCLKRALPQLRGTPQRDAPTIRNHHEFAWFRVAGRICPDAVPRIIGQDSALGLFVMEYLDPRMFPLWRGQLREGHADPAVAAAVGSRLAQIHGATVRDSEIARIFATDAVFYALRIEPYLIAPTRLNPDLAGPLGQLAHTTTRHKLALVHGDVSPENILIGRRGPVFLDAECAWYGDPAFDLAFALGQLLLQCLVNTRTVSRFFSCYNRLAATYLGMVAWETDEEIEARTAHLLPGLLLAAVDGDAPVDYVTADIDRRRVRRVARSLLLDPVDRLHAVREAWSAGLVGM